MTAQLHKAADRALAEGRVGDAIGFLADAATRSPTDFDARMKLAALYRSQGLLHEALGAANAALDVQPNQFVALLLKASLHEKIGEAGRAAEVYRAVVYFADREASLSPLIERQIEHARNFLARQRAAVEASMRSLETLDESHGNRARRFLENTLDRRPVYHQEPTHYRYPGLADIEYLDEAYSDLRRRLHDAWEDIRTEFEALHAAHAERRQPYVNFAPGQPQGVWSSLNRSEKWNALHLVRYGERDPVNAARCPRTLEALGGGFQPDVAGITPNIMFSLLAPRTRIPPHHGVANFRAVVHLPLIVPEGCFFRVGHDMRPWVEGDPWIFDDTIEHEAWNDSDEMRVILLADVWRPELDEVDRNIVREFFQSHGTDAEVGAL